MVLSCVFQNGETCLHAAALSGNPAVIYLLLRQNPNILDPRQQNREGLTASDLAKVSGHENIVKILDPYMTTPEKPNRRPISLNIPAKTQFQPCSHFKKAIEESPVEEIIPEKPKNHEYTPCEHLKLTAKKPPPKPARPNGLNSKKVQNSLLSVHEIHPEMAEKVKISNSTSLCHIPKAILPLKTSLSTSNVNEKSSPKQNNHVRFIISDEKGGKRRSRKDLEKEPMKRVQVKMVTVEEMRRKNTKSPVRLEWKNKMEVAQKEVLPVKMDKAAEVRALLARGFQRTNLIK